MLSSHHQDPKRLSDNDLALRAQEHADGFTPLFDRFFDPVYRYFFSRLRHEDNAEDLTSETFMKIYQRLDSYVERGIPFSVWVFKIAHNVLIDFVRRDKAKVTDSLESLEPGNEPSVDFDLGVINHSILSEKLWATLRVLPKRQQDIWALKLTNDLSHKDIAEIIGITENHVNVDVSRSMKTLKKYLSFLSDAHA